MKLLLDTHALLWYALNDSQLSPAAVTAIRDPANDVYVSAACYWELAIKVSIGKLTVQPSFQDFQNICESQYRFLRLSIEPAHTARVSTLPFPRNHRDPFDRLLIAQAMVEQIPIVSGDPAFDLYSVTRIW